MKRRLLIIVICLLLGAVVNVAVAWGIVGWLPIDAEGRATFPGWALSDTAPPCWIFMATTRTSCSHSIAAPVTTQARYDRSVSQNLPVKKDVIPLWSRIRERPSVALALSSELSQYDPTDLSHHEVLFEDAYGWPMLALSTAELESTRGAKQKTFTPINGIEVGDFGWVNRRHYFLLPLRPIRPGFAVNTLFYAAVLWLLIAGPFALRRFLRLKRGLCPKCAYPMGESSVCTECGCEFPKRARTA